MRNKFSPRKLRNKYNRIRRQAFYSENPNYCFLCFKYRSLNKVICLYRKKYYICKSCFEAIKIEKGINK